MSKEDKIARNVVTFTFMLVMAIMFLLMSSCGSSKHTKKCCERTAQEVYEYKGLTVE